MKYLASDIGGTKTSIGVVEDHRVQERFTWPTDVSAGAPGIQRAINDQAQQFLSGNTIAACGIGFGGQFDFGTQRALRSVHVPGWANIDLRSWAEESFSVPSIADNDANVGAMAEALFGSGRGFASVVYLTMSTGIGGAHVVGGALQRGAHGLAGEFGHLTLDPTGPMCGCGLQGCAERFLSGLWLRHEYGESAEQLFLDPEFLATYTQRLAELLQQVTMVVDPDIFILGGGIGTSTPRLAQLAHEYLSQRLKPWNRSTPHVRMASLAGNSVLIGAGLLAKERYGESE